METTCQSLSQPKLLGCSTTASSVSPSIFHSKASLLVSNSAPFHSSKSILTQQLKGLRIEAKRDKKFGVVHASETDQSATTDVAERWLLEPVGDIHLAMFRVSKIKNVEIPSKQEESEEKSDSPVSSETS